jgi:serine/threonine-protein kinase
LARFRREAQILASLNHPHIGGIYGFDEANGTQFLVLELVDGETLASRLVGGRLPLDEALTIARQIAEALEAAHERGIVHRDLKPANIALTADGHVKVLDFGLAKAVESSGAGNLANSPTLTSPAMMTGAGVILGTAAYMSPEQAKGRPADKRSDVWAFGCVLYEMLAGRRAFEGEDVSDMLASVLRGEPDWNALPSIVPPAIRALVQGCLRKDRTERIGDISTARFLLNQPATVPAAATPSGTRPRSIWRLAIPIALGTLVGAAVTVAVLRRPTRSPAAPVTRFTIALPQGQTLIVPRESLAISPDGSHIVYAADGRLYLRSMTEFDARAIPGAEPAIKPVFSPDGESLLFWGDGALRRIGIGGGAAITICEASLAPSGVTWGSDSILFAQGGRGIMRVSPNGGKPEVLVPLSISEGLTHGPQLLPDGHTLLFTIAQRTAATVDPWDKAQIVVQSLETGDRKTLIEGATDGRYVPTGHIVYALGGTLFARPFDLGKLTFTAGPVPVVEGVLRTTAATAGGAHFSFSNAGSLIYLPGPTSAGQQGLFLFDRKGGAEALKVPAGSYLYPRVSPDGKRIAFQTSDGKETVVSIYELSGASSVRRLTFGGNNRFPVWSADGRHVAFQSDREGDAAVFWQPADGGTPERLTKPEPGASHVPESWFGDTLLFSVAKASMISLWTLSVRDREAQPFDDVRSAAPYPTDAMFSPDGKWVTYQVGTSDGGEAITHVQPFPPNGSTYQIARGGRPLWSRDGKELFYVPAPSLFMAVGIRTKPSFSFTAPVAIPRRFGIADPASPRPYDMVPDGRILGVGVQGQSQSGSPGPAEIRVVLNWFEELKARVPTR